MKAVMILALIAGNLASSASPLAAATPFDQAAARSEVGAFVGGRVRISLGRRSEKPQAGIMLSPLRRTQGAAGEVRLQFGEGLEFGLKPGDKPRLTVAGASLAGPGLHLGEESDAKAKGSGLRTAAYVVGGLLLGGAIVYGLLVREAIENSD